MYVKKKMSKHQIQKIILTPTDVLNWPSLQKTRDETICKQHTDEKKLIPIFLDNTIYNNRTILYYFKIIRTNTINKQSHLKQL